MIINSAAEYQAAQTRIDQLTASDFVDLGDVDELRRLLLAVAAWEAAEFSAILRRAAPAPGTIKDTQRIPVPITSVEEYEAATARAQELRGAIEGSPEDAELNEISDAIMVWDRRNDDATSWE